MKPTPYFEEYYLTLCILSHFYTNFNTEKQKKTRVLKIINVLILLLMTCVLNTSTLYIIIIFLLYIINNIVIIVMIILINYVLYNH